MKKRGMAIASTIAAVWGVIAAKLLCKMSEIVAEFILYGGPTVWEIELCFAFIFVMCVSCVAFCFVLDRLVGGLISQKEEQDK